MENVQIQTAQHVAIDFEVAGLGDRALAALIDYAILYFYYGGAIVFFWEWVLDHQILMVFIYLPVFFYFLLCEVFLNGQSIGKRVRSLKVARLDGGQPTLGNYLMRWMLRPIDLDFTTGMVGVVTVLVNGKGQRLGDIAAGTTVVKIKPRVLLNDTVFARLEEQYTPTFYQVEALDDADILAAREVLDTLITDRLSLTTHQLGMRIKEVLERKMGVSSTLAPFEFLRTVIKDYNYVKGRV